MTRVVPMSDCCGYAILSEYVDKKDVEMLTCTKCGKPCKKKLKDIRR